MFLLLKANTIFLKNVTVNNLWDYLISEIHLVSVGLKISDGIR